MVAVGATVGRLCERAFELGGRPGGGAVIYRRARGEAWLELTEGWGWGVGQRWEGKPAVKGFNRGEDRKPGRKKCGDRCVVLR